MRKALRLFGRLRVVHSCLACSAAMSVEVHMIKAERSLQCQFGCQTHNENLCYIYILHRLSCTEIDLQYLAMHHIDFWNVPDPSSININPTLNSIQRHSTMTQPSLTLMNHYQPSSTSINQYYHSPSFNISVHLTFAPCSPSILVHGSEPTAEDAQWRAGP